MYRPMGKHRLQPSGGLGFPGPGFHFSYSRPRAGAGGAACGLGFLFQVFLSRFFIKFLGFPFDNFQGALRTFFETGGQPIAILFLHQPGFAVNQRQRPFRARIDTGAAAVAFGFIYLNYFS